MAHANRVPARACLVALVVAGFLLLGCNARSGSVAPAPPGGAPGPDASAATLQRAEGAGSATDHAAIQADVAYEIGRAASATLRRANDEVSPTDDAAIQADLGYQIDRAPSSVSAAPGPPTPRRDGVDTRAKDTVEVVIRGPDGKIKRQVDLK